MCAMRSVNAANANGFDTSPTWLLGKAPADEGQRLVVTLGEAHQPIGKTVESVSPNGRPTRAAWT